MKRFWKITKTEFLTIFKDGGLLLILFGALLIYGTLYPTIYAPQVVRDLPVAVVDLDDTPPSRKLTRMLDATPEAAVRYEAQSLDEARQLFLDRKVYGALYIPQGYEKRMLAGEQNQVSLYADGGYFLLYSDFMGAVGKVVGTAGAEVQVGRLLAGGMNR
ncbi:MAG: ABC transporter permease [Rikenella sp.]|nr:ABC transporter permease [Rikenella sp.]